MAELQSGVANITINGDGIAALRTDMTQAIWEAGVRLQLHNLLYVPPFNSSRDVVNAMVRTSRKAVIKPAPQPTAAKPKNAYAGPLNWQGATPSGQAPLYCADDKTIPGDQTGTPLPGMAKGTGAGTDIEITYTAQDWITNAGDPGGRPDEILLHEMVHGLRQQRGQLLCTAKSAPDQRYDTIEELFAIVVSNIYRSECNYKSLRADHHGFAQLKSPLDDENEFYKKWKGELDQLTREMTYLCIHLSVIRCKYNPIRAAMRQQYTDSALVTIHNGFVEAGIY
jgi:hypothetical protein